MNKGKTITFTELFDEVHRIEIPVIQRDYAQGREETREIREQFLDSIKTALENEFCLEPLDLDFIYGNLEGEENNICFSVLDGQQRLTTLFLIHWFLAIKDDKYTHFLHSFTSEGKSRFTYKTRTSAIEFFDALVAVKPESLDITISPLKEQIIDSKWFYLSWNQDPTISSCLTMLDSIQERFSKQSVGLYDRLCCVEPRYLVFQHLNLHSFGLSDDLYIKMNSRGKVLTPFENFKAWLSKHINHSPDANRFRQKIDQEWTDLFWNIKKKLGPDDKKMEFDYLYFRFFTLMTLLRTCEKIGQPYALSQEKTDWLISLRDVRKSVSPIEFEKHQSFEIEDITQIEKILDFLCSAELGQRGKDLLQDLLVASDYVSQSRFYALCIFILSSSEKNIGLQKISFLRWLRVTDNLINTMRIDGLLPLISVVRALNELSTHTDMLYEWMAEDNKRPGLFSNQWKEEALKAELILHNISWEKELIHAEQHPFLKGKVMGLLNLSCELGSSELSLSKYNIERFKQVTEKTFRILNEKILHQPEHLLERALLTLGDYLVPQGSENRYSFCLPAHNTWRERDENWLRVVSEPVYGQLLEKVNGDVVKDLNKIILEVNCGGWRELVVNNPKMISYCNERLVDKSKDQIYLLSKSTFRGYFAELRTYVLSERLLALSQQGKLPNDIKYIEYHAVYGNEYPYIELTLSNETPLYIAYDKEQYIVYEDPEEERKIPHPEFFKKLLEEQMPEDSQL